MIDQNYINQIMSELGLNPNDDKARKILERLISSKPEVPINKAFLAQLRQQLQEEGNLAATPKPLSMKSFTMLTINRVLASALVVMIVLGASGFWYIQNRTDKPLFQSPEEKAANQVLSGKYSVNNVSEESFGDLSKVAILSSKDVASKNSTKGSTPTMASSAASGMGGAPASGSDASGKAIAPGEPYPGPTQYTFKYTGSDLPNLADNQGVLKRTQIQQPESLVSRIISMLSFGLIDLTKFTNAKITSFAFSEDRDYGYSVNVDMYSGSVGIYQNWDKWSSHANENLCIKDSNPCGPRPAELGDIPANDVLFQATDQFLSDYGISREAYGQPIVNNDWYVQYQNASEADRANLYIPEDLTVVYPLLLEGQKVYDESGNVYGLVVNYNVRFQKVTAVYELNTKQFQKSQYQGVTDSKQIIDSAEHGGFRNYVYPLDASAPENRNMKTAELDLDTPTIQLVKLWYADPNDPNSQSGELYVPSLVFPIKNWAKTNYWRKDVVVPLVKDIFDSDYQNVLQQPQQTPPQPGQPIPVDQPVGTMSAQGSNESSPVILPKQQ